MKWFYKLNFIYRNDSRNQQVHVLELQWIPQKKTEEGTYSCANII